MARFEIPQGWTAQAYQFALDPSPSQVRLFESHCGAARFAYNYMLDVVKKNLNQRVAERSYGVDEAALTPAQGWSLAKLRKTWNEHKSAVAPWWEANSKEAYNSGLDGLARALANWSASTTGKRPGAAIGFPRLKSRRVSARSVRFTTGAIRVAEDRQHVVLPRLGRIRTHESTRKLNRRLEAGTARILSATVAMRGGRWFCTFQVIVANKGRRPRNAARSRHPVVGIDVGVRDLLVVATPDGDEVVRIPAAKPFAQAQARLAALQRRASRQRGPYDRGAETRREPSKRWQRTQARVGRTHTRIANLRAHQLHVATTALATRHETVVVESLHVAGMRRRDGSHKRGLNRALGDAALGRIRTQLGYKAKWYGSEAITAPRWYPSTQMCSRCGTKTKLALRDRTYRCRNGCPPIDRDLNAAINLARLGDPLLRGTGTGTGSGPAANQRVGDGRGAIHKTSPTTVAGTAGGVEASTPRTVKTGTADPQGEAA